MKRKNLILSASVLLLTGVVMFITSCKKEDPDPPSPVATKVELVSGGAQSATIESPLANPIEVLVTDKDGAPFAGAKIAFGVTEGSVSSTNVNTNAQGKASVTWTLGSTVGSQIMTATSFKADGTTPLSGSPITINATANAVVPVATSLELVSGGDQSGGVELQLENEIKIIVKDQNGNPFRNADVSFSVNEGSVSPSTGQTNINGNATTSWTLGSTAGSQTLTITAYKADGTTPLTGSPLSVNATANEKEASTIELEDGDNQEGTANTVLQRSIKVRVKDQYGIVIEGTTVNFEVSEGSVSHTSKISDNVGLAQVDWTLGATEGTQTLTITAFKDDGTTPLSGSPITVNATALEMDAATIELLAGDNQTGLINSTLKTSINLKIKDLVGVGFQGTVVNFSVTEGSVLSTSVISNNSGSVSNIWTLGPTAGTQTLTISAFKNDGITHLDGSPIVVTAEALTISAGAPLTDYDGNVYSTVNIGNQTWMAENLKVTHYADGTEIPLITDGPTWYDLPGTDLAEARAYTYYDFNSSSGYGYLYTWVAAMNLSGSTTNNPSGIQGVCPDGWHLPSLNEFTDLFYIFGGTSYAGGPLKEEGTANWTSPNTNATNISGFTALPGGNVVGSGVFSYLGTRAQFWTATENSYLTVKTVYLRNTAENVTIYNNTTKNTGLSVRCVKD